MSKARPIVRNSRSPRAPPLLGAQAVLKYISTCAAKSVSGVLSLDIPACPGRCSRISCNPRLVSSPGPSFGQLLDMPPSAGDTASSGAVVAASTP
eukprot:5864028-Amphidinium_carterae.1